MSRARSGSSLENSEDDEEESGGTFGRNDALAPASAMLALRSSAEHLQFAGHPGEVESGSGGGSSSRFADTGFDSDEPQASSSASSSAADRNEEVCGRAVWCVPFCC